MQYRHGVVQIHQGLDAGESALAPGSSEERVDARPSDAGLHAEVPERLLPLEDMSIRRVEPGGSRRLEEFIDGACDE